jgi:hypothetical protein
MSVEECLRFLDLRQQLKMQWLEDPNQGNVENLNHVRREASRQFRKIKEDLKDKIVELETNSKMKNIRDMYGCNIRSALQHSKQSCHECNMQVTNMSSSDSVNPYPPNVENRVSS